MEGTKLIETNSLFEEEAKKRNFYSAKLLRETSRLGSVQKIKEVPKDTKKIFATALDMNLEWHVKMQAAFQKHTDNGVSKTINLREEATKEDVRNAYLLAYKLGCKGITVFRYASKHNQVLYFEDRQEKIIKAESEFSGGCPIVHCGN